MIKALSNLDGANKAELSNQVLGTALTLLHEYGHHGDKITNNGKNTGQYVSEENAKGTPFRRQYSTLFGKEENDDAGKQVWKTTLTGHRGTDIETLGFGVKVDIQSKGKADITKGALSPTTWAKGITVPTSTPDNAKGENILKTLNVK
jgi:hypothetical protein